MADTVDSRGKTIERPTMSYKIPAHPGYLERGDRVPPADELDLETIDFADTEIWRQNKMWDRFERLRKEDPVHLTPDSFFGPYWSITRHQDIVAIDSDHKGFSSDASQGGITLVKAEMAPRKSMGVYNKNNILRDQCPRLQFQRTYLQCRIGRYTYPTACTDMIKSLQNEEDTNRDESSRISKRCQ